MANDHLDGGDGLAKGRRAPSRRDGDNVPDALQRALERSLASGPTYGAALAISSPVVPLAAAIITVGAYYQHPIPDAPTLFGGTVIAAALWLIVAFLCRGLTTVHGASSQRYDDLRGRLARLDIWLGLKSDSLKSDKTSEDAKLTDLSARPGYVDNSDALQVALARRNEAYREMELADLRWVARTGYQSMWKQIHYAEAALLEILPVAEVVGSMRADYLRLVGSRIGNSQQLLSTLVTAVRVLSPEAAVYFPSQSGQDGSGNCSGGNGTQTGNTAPDTVGATPQPQQTSAASEAHARSMLSQVRTSINVYRDSHWDGLVRARNQLIVTVLVSSVVTYLMVELAIVGGVDRLALLTAAVLYFVGTIFGLLKRLYDESQVSRAVDDYGLSMTRIITTPMFSGLAAIAGVALYALGVAFAGTAGTGAGTTLVLNHIFDLSKYPLDVVTAAIFGLAPNFLVNYVQQQSKQYVGDIKSSETADTSATVGSTTH